MNKFVELILSGALILFLVGFSYAQNDLSSLVPELQLKERKAGIVCGVAGMILVTNKEEIKITGDLTSRLIFGPRIVIADLMPLLEARVNANRTGEENPMSGNVDSLTGQIIHFVSLAREQAAIPVLAALLEDKDRDIHTSASRSLIEMAKINEEFRREIEKITFPRKTLSGQQYKDLPTWLKIKEDN